VITTRWLSYAAVLAWSLFVPSVSAHKASDSLLTLERNGAELRGQWDIALRDLDVTIGLDANADGKIEWGEVKAKHAEIANYAMSRLAISAGDKPCTLSVTEHLLEHHGDGTYAVMRFIGGCHQARADTMLNIDYRLFFDIDTQHRGLVKLNNNGRTRSAIFPASQPVQAFKVDEGEAAQGFLDFVSDGIKHIAVGFDHILFLVMLLLPAVLIRTDQGDKRTRPVTTFRRALLTVATIVTAFTVAHSITLSAATLGIVSPPSRWVEILIAVSVVITAIDNVVPLFPAALRKRPWLIAFGFGLIHGFGFAGVLQGLNLPRADLMLSLIGFNVGVEIGQLALVAFLLPAAYAIRARSIYPRVVLTGGSVATASIAAGWLLERSIDFQFMPF
jgi:hypothetical protein